MSNYLPRPVLGVAYYPEHWTEERWQLDAEQMRTIGLKVVRLAEFSWGKIESSPEEYDFEWLDRAINVLNSQGLRVILGTPTAAPPPWMAEHRSDILAHTRDGHVLTVGGRHFYCPSNAYYRTQVTRIAREMARHYLNNYSIIGWQVDNEMGNHGNCRCYCQRCATNWYAWLQNRYQTIEVLNREWGTIFWGQIYKEWSQIPLPTQTGAGYSPSLELEYRRFASDNALEYFNLQVDAIREHWTPKRGFITHNVFYGDDNVNFHDLSAPLDFISWDNYPHGMKAVSEIAFYHDFMFGLKNEPYWVMEQAVGSVNWTTYNPPVYPGQVRLWTLQNFLRGGQGAVYFSWRQSRFGGEQYHSAILSHEGVQTRAYYEIMDLSKELDALPPQFFRRQKARVAILFSYDDLWALQLEPHNAAFDYIQIVKDLHNSLYKRYIPVDILPHDYPAVKLKEYSLVIAPAPIIGDYYTSDMWRVYVEEGGKLLLVTRAGAKEPSNIWSDEGQPYALKDWLHIGVEEYISFPPFIPGNFNGEILGNQPACGDIPLLLCDEVTGRQVNARRLWAERLEQGEDVEIILRYGKSNELDFFANSVALACRKLESGEAYYLGVLPNEQTYRYLWEELFRIECTPAIPNLPLVDGLEVVRTGELHQYFALINHNSHSIQVLLNRTYRKIKGEEVLEINLPPFGVEFFYLS